MKINQIFLCIISFVLVTNISLAQSYNIGDGAKYGLTFAQNPGQEAQLEIYVTDSKFNKLNIEMHFFQQGSLIPMEMWHQTEFNLTDHGVIPINGYVTYQLIDNQDSKPEKYDPLEYGSYNPGLQIKDFIFSKAEDIDKFKIGSESVETPAGTVIAAHYRKSENGQTLDFWISDQVKNIGIVKMESKGKDPSQNYSIQLKSLIRNVGAKINPTDAIPLTEATKQVLPKPF